MILALVLVLVVPYYVRLRRLLGSHARVPRAPRRGGGPWRGRELDRAADVLRRGRVGRCVAPRRCIERNQEEGVRVQQERHAVVRMRAYARACGRYVRRDSRKRELFAAGEGVGAKAHVPEHDENVRDVVHAIVVNVV